MGTLRADEQEPHRRPIQRVEVAQHTEDVWYARGGKCGGSAAEQRALTWGDLSGVSRAEVSRGHSSRGTSRSAEKRSKVAGGLNR